MGGSFSFPNSLPSMSFSDIKFPNMNNVQRFISGITEKLPSRNNTIKFFKPVGNLASKATSVLTSNTSKTIAKNVGTAILKNKIRRSSGVYNKPKRRHTFGGSKKKEISDKFNTIHDEITSKKETTPSKKEKKPPKKETTPSKKEKKPPKKEKTPPKKEKKSSKK
jgi:hypothetical protein